MIFVFTALFSQVHTLYACDSMADTLIHVCCCEEHNPIACPMADGCAMDENTTAETSCCELSYGIVNDAGMISSTSAVDCLTLLLNGPQPPSVVDLQQFQQFIPTPLPVLSRLSLAADETLIFSRGNPIFLLTRRLRL
ncbi:MAG: hypothetical protein V3V22_09550 [Methylococcales bacterium]